MKVSILKVEPINFSIRNPQEKDLVISTFQKFLNSLDFPIQIVVATDMLNIDHYLTLLEEKAEEVSKKTNHNYRKLCADFKDHLQSMISSKGLLNRSFYVVIAEKQ